MGKVIFDPEEARRFASALSEMARRLQSRTAQVENAFDDLGEVWRDEKYLQFERIFKETVERMERFLRYADVYAEYLVRKAKPAERYLEKRYRGR